MEQQSSGREKSIRTAVDEEHPELLRILEIVVKESDTGLIKHAVLAQIIVSHAAVICDEARVATLLVVRLVNPVSERGGGCRRWVVEG